MNKPDFSLEQDLENALVVGVDEAGCGPWAGPVVAAAVVFFDYKNQHKWQELNDSKKLSPAKRALCFEQLLKASSVDLVYSVGFASVEEIDILNIGKATMLAMERAVSSLAVLPSYALIDGIRKPNLSIPFKMVKKGDGISLSIAAASIIAKVTRDKMMQELDVLYPEYGWVNNAGYGTATHIKAIQTYGITPHHRKSFQPIKACLKEAA